MSNGFFLCLEILLLLQLLPPSISNLLVAVMMKALA